MNETCLSRRRRPLRLQRGLTPGMMVKPQSNKSCSWPWMRLVTPKEEIHIDESFTIY